MGIMRIFTIILFLTLGASFTLFSQEIGEEVRNGIKYKVHIVEGGNTLYGLQNKYKVSTEEIIKANPSAKDGLQIGQKLYIPIAVGQETKEPSFEMHTVKRKETLFGISRQYNCSIDDLIKYNPEVEDGLKIGQVIRIPTSDVASEELVETKEPEVVEELEVITETFEENPFQGEEIEEIEEIEERFSVTFEDSIINYTVQKGETIYSISKRFMVSVEKLSEVNNIKNGNIREGQTIVIPLKRERVQEIEVRDLRPIDTEVLDVQLVTHKDKYRVLVALPLNIGSNAEAMSGMYTENTKLNSLTDISLDFLMGAQMALDSLENLGLNADVEFFDTRANLDVFKEKLNSNKTWDIIIGPFYPKLFEYAATWGKENRVPVIAVTKMPSKVLENNPYAISLVPSDLTLISGMAHYLAKNHSDENIVLIQGENQDVNNKIDYFQSEYAKALGTGKTSNIRVTSVGGTGGGHLLGYINPSKKSYMICLSNNVQQVMRFVNALNAAKNTSPKYRKADVVLVGLREWKDIPALSSYYKNRFNLHFAGIRHLDYRSDANVDFTLDYRNRYGADPSKYSFHGYDVLLSQCASLLLGINRDDGLMNSFNLHSLGANHGKENSSAFISEQRDYEIRLLEVITK